MQVNTVEVEPAQRCAFAREVDGHFTQLRRGAMLFPQLEAAIAVLDIYLGVRPASCGYQDRTNKDELLAPDCSRVLDLTNASVACSRAVLDRRPICSGLDRRGWDSALSSGGCRGRCPGRRGPPCGCRVALSRAAAKRSSPGR